MHYLLEECRWEVTIYLCIPPYFFIFFILGRNILGRNILGRKIIELSFTVIMLWYVIKRIYGKLQQQLVKYKACWTKDSHLEAQNMSLESKYEESSLLQNLHCQFLAKRIFLCIENGKGQKGLNAVPSSLQYFDLLPNTAKKVTCNFIRISSGNSCKS